jgi:hypothetical protein
MTHDDEARLRALWEECPERFHPAGSYDEFQRCCAAKIATLTAEQRDILAAWLAIGRQNPWIARAVDPPFTVLSFHFCRDVRELAERLLHGNWCLGQAFALGEICFINQVNGGDEWLTIKGRTPFESITMQTFTETRENAEHRLYRTVERIRKATEEQCRQLLY